MTRIHLSEQPNTFLYHNPQTLEYSHGVGFRLNELPTFSPKTQELVVKILEERFNPPQQEANNGDQAAANRALEERNILALAKLKTDSEYKSFDQLRNDAAALQTVGNPDLFKIVVASTLQTVVLSSAALYAVIQRNDLSFDNMERKIRDDVATAFVVVNATEILRSTWKGYKASSKTFEHYASKMEETLDKEGSFLEHNGPYLINRIGQLIANIDATEMRDKLHGEISSDKGNCKNAKVEIINALNFHRKLKDFKPITFKEAVEKGMWVKETVATENDLVVDGELLENANPHAHGDANWSCAIL